MAAGAPKTFVRTLIRIASLQGRVVLEGILTNQFDIVSNQSGRQISGTSSNGKSVTFYVPATLTIDELMAATEEALTIYDAMGGDADADDKIADYLTTIPQSRTRIQF